MTAKIFHATVLLSYVADPGFLSRIPGPVIYPFRIPDPGSRIQQQQQKRRGEKLVVLPFFVATIITKLLLSSQKYGFAIGEPEKTYPVDIRIWVNF